MAPVEGKGEELLQDSPVRPEDAIDQAKLYHDRNLVEIYFDREDKKNICTMSYTIRDKILFVIFAMDILVSPFVGGYVPKHYYLFYTFKAAVLIGYQFYLYHTMKWHYEMIQLCYVGNMLILVYLWTPLLGDTIRGYLFTISYSITMGPLLWSVLTWRNSLVLHSRDKMTNLFLHVSPAVTLWTIRWFSTKDQGFPLCAYQTEPGPDGCQYVGFKEIVFQPMVAYVCYLAFYYLITDVGLRRFHGENEKEYTTIYKRLVEQGNKNLRSTVMGMFGPKYHKLMFYVLNVSVIFLNILLSYNCYHGRNYNLAVALLMLTVASYNGATFYIDVFSERYHLENRGQVTSNRELKQVTSDKYKQQ